MWPNCWNAHSPSSICDQARTITAESRRVVSESDSGDHTVPTLRNPRTALFRLSVLPLLTQRYRAPHCFPSVRKRLDERPLVWGFSENSAWLQTGRNTSHDFAAHLKMRTRVSESLPFPLGTSISLLLANL
jgi:hypothetical protein